MRTPTPAADRLLPQRMILPSAASAHHSLSSSPLCSDGVGIMRRDHTPVMQQALHSTQYSMNSSNAATAYAKRAPWQSTSAPSSRLRSNIVPSYASHATLGSGGGARGAQFTGSEQLSEMHIDGTHGGGERSGLSGENAVPLKHQYSTCVEDDAELASRRPLVREIR